MLSDTLQSLELDDAQGIILYGYDHLPCTRYLLLGVRDAVAARRWLSELAPRVATGRPRTTGEARPASALHVAVTAEGLRAIGFDEATIQTFPRGFQVGMTNPYRSQILGDIDASEPGGWEFGGPRNPPIHLLLLLHAATEEAIDKLALAERERCASGGLSVFREEAGWHPADGREHFGFLDGVSQPAIAGSGQKSSDGQPPIKAGEFILGYENEYDELPVSPTVALSQDPGSVLPDDPRDPMRHDLGRNGTFLALRKLSQDVAAFWRFAGEQARHTDGTPDSEAMIHLAARMIGRWPGGAPLVLSPRHDDPQLGSANQFQYRDRDAAGLSCPLGAHIRRTNPRDALPPDAGESIRETRRHRLIRRGRLYGPKKQDLYSPDDDRVARGLQFLAINANLHRQFEFIQQTWINSPKANQLYDDPDPLLGVHPQRGRRNFTVQEQPARRVCALPSFIGVKGGAYFFLPSVRALRFMGGPTYATRGGAVEEIDLFPA